MRATLSSSCNLRSSSGLGFLLLLLPASFAALASFLPSGPAGWGSARVYSQHIGHAMLLCFQESRHG